MVTTTDSKRSALERRRAARREVRWPAHMLVNESASDVLCVDASGGGLALQLMPGAPLPRRGEGVRLLVEPTLGERLMLDGEVVRAFGTYVGIRVRQVGPKALRWLYDPSAS